MSADHPSTATNSALCTIELSNGVHLPCVGLGSYRAKGQLVRDAVTWALSVGIRHIDTATIYKNESDIRAAIQQSPESTHKVFVTSKVSPYEQGTEKATKACNAILQRHVTECLDLVLVHWPGTAKHALASPIHANERLQTWHVLEKFYLAGKFKAIGVSNYAEHHLLDLLAVATVKPHVNQIEVHPRYPQHSLRKLCADNNIAVVAYSSLGVGDLVGNPIVQQVAQESQHTPAQVLLRWGLQQGCAVIPKSTTREHIAEASPAALTSWSLTGAQMEKLDAMNDGYKYCWDPQNVE